MTPLVYANEVVFCFTVIAYLIAALIGAVCFAMSVSYKLKWYYVLPEVFVSAVAAAMFCGFSDGIKIRYFGESPLEHAGSLCFAPLFVIILIAAVLNALAVLWLVLAVKKRLSALTAMSVKEAIAALSTGLCFYDETGRVLLLNEQIASDCYAVTGESLYDGVSFWQNLNGGKVLNGVSVAVNNGLIIAERQGGKAVCFKRVAHNFGGKTVYEIVGTDITKESALKKQLEEKNAELHEMNMRLKRYGETVAEVTKERETLAARVKVHGNLGSLILRTKKAFEQGDYDKDGLISAWGDITKLIFAADECDDKFFEAETTAAKVGVKIVYDGKLPKKGTNAEKIFAAAVFECAVNTARHTGGNELRVKITETESAYNLIILNNGKPPKGEINEGGGLSSLRTMAENAGGQMLVKSAPSFSLSVTLPKEKQ